MYSKEQAFTLIELLIVVLVIGILSSVILPQYQLAIDKSKYSTIMPLIRAIKDAQEVYYFANGEYATSVEKLAINLPWTSTVSPKGDMNISLNGQAYVSGRILREGKEQNAFLMWYDHWDPSTKGLMECYAYTGDRSERLCKSVTGKSKLTDSCDGTCKKSQW